MAVGTRTKLTTQPLYVVYGYSRRVRGQYIPTTTCFFLTPDLSAAGLYDARCPHLNPEKMTIYKKTTLRKMPDIAVLNPPQLDPRSAMQPT
jgi:hypothetical protein